MKIGGREFPGNEFMALSSGISRCGSWVRIQMKNPAFRIWLTRLGVCSLFLITLIPTQNLMIDRLFMALEILLLLRMLKLDQTNQTAISRFLTERELWYKRRAQIKQLQMTGTPTSDAPIPTSPELPPTGPNENAPETNPGQVETVVMLQETELEQSNDA
jgi:hypothetical protein